MAEDFKRDAVKLFCRGLPQQVRGITELFGTLLAPGSFDRTPVARVLRAEAHRLAGTSGSLGFEGLSALFSYIESSLAAVPDLGREPPEALRQTLRNALALLDRESASATPDNSALLRDPGPAPPQEEAGDSLLELLARQHVLFADDDLSMRWWVRGALVDARIGKVSLAASGAETLEMARLLRPTLLILDWNMAPMSGLDVLERVRGNQAGLPADTPVIFLTRENKQAEVRRAQKLGVSHFVTKPFRAEVLTRAVHLVLKREAERAEARSELHVI